MNIHPLISTRSMASISDKLTHGKLPRRVLALVRQWRKLHMEELMEDWNLAQAHKTLKLIEPLE